MRNSTFAIRFAIQKIVSIVHVLPNGIIKVDDQYCDRSALRASGDVTCIKIITTDATMTKRECVPCVTRARHTTTVLLAFSPASRFFFSISLLARSLEMRNASSIISLLLYTYSKNSWVRRVCLHVPGRMCAALNMGKPYVNIHHGDSMVYRINRFLYTYVNNHETDIFKPSQANGIKIHWCLYYYSRVV